MTKPITPWDGFGRFESGAVPVRGGSIWDAAKLKLQTQPATLWLTSFPAPEDPIPPPRRTGNGAPPVLQGVCLMMAGRHDLRLILPANPVPIRRHFYLIGKRDIIARIDGLKVSVAAD